MRTNARTIAGLTLLASGVVIGLSLAQRGIRPALPVPADSPGAAGRPTPAAPATTPRFRDVAAEAGVKYQWRIEGKRPLNIRQTIGNGCAFLDYDNDGNLDILLVGQPCALFRGDGKGHFADVSAETGVAALKGEFLGVASGDYDGDGFTDLYLSAYRGGVLLHNDAGKRFRNVTARSGIASQPWGTSCVFADFDGDNRPDL